jgi:heat shock protein HtpX
MRSLKNIALMFAVGLGISITVSFVLNLLGVQPYLTAYGLNIESLAIFCLVWGMVGSGISLLISKWTVKMMMGVKVIDPGTHNPELRRLVERIHALARRAGLQKMPEVGIYESPELNAFATGPSRNNSLVAVSTGLLNSMSDEEVEGVLGHEIAHVSNGDMITMALVQGVVNATIMFVARIIGFAAANAVEEKNRYWVQMMVVILSEIVLGILGVMIVSWFSRYREFRADKGGADLAGRGKMISALEALQNRSRVFDNAHPQMAAMKISTKPGGMLKFFMSHPPLEERIQALRAL